MQRAISAAVLSVAPILCSCNAIAQVDPPAQEVDQEASDAGSECHPSYRGACVPIVSDVDCLGGNGNGPAYVGRVQVVGPDTYELDRDGDGTACEPTR